MILETDCPCYEVNLDTPSPALSQYLVLDRPASLLYAAAVANLSDAGRHPLLRCASTHDNLKV